MCLNCGRRGNGDAETLEEVYCKQSSTQNELWKDIVIPSASRLVEKVEGVIVV